jgi:hypothetical protein
MCVAAQRCRRCPFFSSNEVQKSDMVKYVTSDIFSKIRGEMEEMTHSEGYFPTRSDSSVLALGIPAAAARARQARLRYVTARQDFRVDKLKLELQQGALQNASAAARWLADTLAPPINA